MSNEINIRIGGDPSGFNKAAREATQSTERLRNSLKEAAGAIPGVNKAAAAAADTLKNKVVPGANQATNAMLNLGRIVQDAPFGFIGIANNINPALESFQRLKAETGSTGAALKALGSSLAGGAGLGLAVSLLTSGLTLFSMSAHGAKASLEGFAKAIDEANKQAGEEIARVQVLATVIADTTRKQSERSGAAKELSGILKDLNINMTQEAILNGQVAEATKKATEAIISRAKARAVEARIGELSGQQLQRDLKKAELTDKLAKAQKNLNDELAKRRPDRNKDEIEQAGINQFFASTKVTDLTNDIRKLDEQTAGANKEIGFLINQIKDNDLTFEKKGGSDKEIDLLKQRIAALKEIQSLQGLDAKQRVELVQLEIKLINRDGPKLGFSPAEIKQQSDALLEQAFPVKTFEFDTVITTRVNKIEPSLVRDPAAITKDFKTDIAKALGLDGKPIEVPMPPVTITQVDPEVKKSLERMRSIATEAVSGAASLIGESLAQAFNGASIGEALASAAKGLMNIVGGILQEVGKNMIATSAAVEVLTTALNGLFGFGGAIAGLAAGALLISVGALVKNIDLPKFADGGIVNKATLGIFGERGPEAILPLSKLPGLFKALSNAGADNQQPIVLNGNLRIDGTDLSLALERVQSRRRRLG